MKGLRYTLLELEKEFRNRTCDFCSNRFGKDNEAVNEIITREETTNKLVGLNMVCENCKEKFENNELLKCERCGKLQTKIYLDFFTGKYNCSCEKEEKELPSLPHEHENERESMTAFYERQINKLREELTTAEETIEIEREAHEDFMEKSEEWGKRQKQELIDKMEKLKKEKGQSKATDSSSTISELISRIEKLEAEVKQLKEQQVAQVEVKKWPWKLGKNNKN